MVELLKQGQYKPCHVTDQILSIFAGSKGYLDDLPISKVAEFEEQMHTHFRDEFPEVRNELTEKQVLDEAIQKKILEILDNFKKRFAPEAQAETEAGA